MNNRFTVDTDACRGELLFARIHRLCLTGNFPGVRLLFTLSLLGFTSCTQQSFTPDMPERNAERHEITLYGSLGDIDSEVTPATRGDADPTKAMILCFARVERNISSGAWVNYFSGGDAPVGYYSATRAAGTGNQAITFTATQYYPMGKLYGQESANSYNEIRFIGWSPVHTTIASTRNEVIISSANGTNDIMLSNEVTGSYSSPFTSSANQFTFRHVLSKIIVWCKAADAAAPAAWGNVTDINVSNQYASYNVVLTSGSVTGATPASHSLEGFSAKTLTTSYVNCGQLFINPSGSALTLNVTTVRGDTRAVTVRLASGTFTAGNAYNIYLDFKSTAITPSASVTAWGSGGNLPVEAL